MLIGIDMGGTHMRAALVDENGGIVLERKETTRADREPEKITEHLAAICREIMAEAEKRGIRVRAAGLGIAGKIDPARGTVVFSPNLPTLNGVSIGPELERALGVPVAMENDANAFGVGEAWAGAGKDLRNWVGFTLGTGVGGVLILGGKLWEGDGLGFSAELGHMVVDPEGPRCPCGLRGCLEAHSSGTALVQGVKDAALNGTLAPGTPLHAAWTQGVLDPQAVYDASHAGDALATALLSRMGWALGLALANLFTALGVNHAIIGGGVAASWDRFIAPLRESLAAHTTMLAPDEMFVLRSTLGDDAALIGSARLALNRV